MSRNSAYWNIYQGLENRLAAMNISEEECF